MKKKPLKILIRGSILIPILIIFFIISVVALSIVQQTVTGIKITSDSQRSHQSYQYSDQEAENALNTVRNFDDIADSFVIRWNTFYQNSIPENLIIGTQGNCNYFLAKNWDDSNPSVSCYTDTAGTVGISSTSLLNIKAVKTTGASGSLQRGILVPLPNRINNTISGFSVERVGVGDSHPNSLKISWDRLAVGASANIGGVEIRASQQPFLNTPVTSGATDSKGWFRVADLTVVGVGSTALEQVSESGNQNRGRSFIYDHSQNTGHYRCQYFIENSGGKSICYMSDADSAWYNNIGVDFFTIKLKNYNNFNLDSAYYSPIMITTACRATGFSCSRVPNNCCSGLACDVGRCVNASSCTPHSRSCFSDNDCCSGYFCDDGDGLCELP